MRSLIKKHGRSQIQPWLYDPFDRLISSIASQQLSTKAAATINSRIYQRLGVDCFTPKAILSLKKEDLRQCGLSNAKADYCLGIAKAAADKSIHFKTLHSLPYEELAEQLTQLKGVGIWTVEMLAIFALGYRDIWSYGDLGLKKGIKILHQLPELPDKDTFEQLGEKWRPYRSIASWYLWRVAES
ncbi:DNA-3-methyladenine glycosylase [Pleionea sp. CnH1-48]|uniref:DNA-3-methyladenine glycosylase family protein n=1 Tax=Pleionea sp. CnH1-48 TaxID=2954494 RepID=UPI002096FF6B|nr:DNA-3-methyladenine glycosylase [Pleionea sp. CnH1-48]MCO7226189.1 DNA-3-methyladenine glycosylase [Pleionea sp. CnH1-48]